MPLATSTADTTASSPVDNASRAATLPASRWCSVNANATVAPKELPLHQRRLCDSRSAEPVLLRQRAALRQSPELDTYTSLSEARRSYRQGSVARSLASAWPNADTDT